MRLSESLSNKLLFEELTKQLEPFAESYEYYGSLAFEAMRCQKEGLPPPPIPEPTFVLPKTIRFMDREYGFCDCRGMQFSLTLLQQLVEDLLKVQDANQTTIINFVNRALAASTDHEGVDFFRYLSRDDKQLQDEMGEVFDLNSPVVEPVDCDYEEEKHTAGLTENSFQ